MRTRLTETMLDKIVADKRVEVEQLKLATSLRQLQLQAAQAPMPRDFIGALQVPGVNLIAEIKRASPSKGLLRDMLDPVPWAKVYQENGASAISVLTEKKYFRGTLEDLRIIKHAVSLPLLRKDFVFDPSQVYEARAAGADAVLLIVAILHDEALYELHRLINQLDMAALVEVHDEVELKRALELSPRIVGINNRDLKTFHVSLDTSANLISLLPPSVVTVAESGIRTAFDVQRLASLRVDGMLVGESLVTAPDMGAQVRALCWAGSPQ